MTRKKPKMPDLDPSAVWTDKHGQKFPISDLTDEHLNNILRLLYRSNIRKMREKLLKQADAFDKSGDAEDPTDISDGPPSYDHTLADERRDLAESPDREVLKHFIPQLPALEWEAQRRGLIKSWLGSKSP